MEKCLCIIPARGGSKRIPRKNIKNFYGFPIIKYSIDAALSSLCFDEVMVSTEDSEIKEIAVQLGANVPFMRSKKTSDDNATLGDVIEEVLLEYFKIGKKFDSFCCILATAPFVSEEKIRQGYELLSSTNADSIIPVTKFSFPIQRALKIEDGKLKMFWPENYNMRSQDLAPAYRDCGQFYWMKTQSFLEQKKIYAKNAVPLIIPESEEQDIDTTEDWIIAEIKYKILKKDGQI